MHLRRVRTAFFLGLGGSCLGLALFMGCKAGVNDASVGGSGGGQSSGTKSQATGTAQGPGDTSGTSAQFMMSTGAEDAPPDVPINPCGTACHTGADLCDGVNKGLDDNCDGVVDEGCPCTQGQAESCFKGDPSYLSSPGCFPGTQQCTENGMWGPCIGGSHATEGCDQNQTGCHPISSVPFQNIGLATGAGNFDDNADPGSVQWTLDCPGGVMPCPTPDAMGNVQPLVSGEYTVTLTETVGGTPMQCQFPLYVGARGLRVELSWDFPPSDVDLDLHLHQPQPNTGAWDTLGSFPQDCGWANCKIDSFEFGGGGNEPEWFGNPPIMPPDPVNWFLDPVMTNNLCYYAPRNAGQAWIDNGQGCHNPRLDIDNINCDPSITDSTNFDFCVPENINIDYPPTNVWTRVAVHYWSSHVTTATIHPNVKIFCDGKLAAELGSHGYYTPEVPIAWVPGDTDQLWLVGDVFMKKDQCNSECIVQPIYGNATTKLPLYEPNGGPAFGPPYPPNP